MNIQQTMSKIGEIKLYDKGTSVMWTDEYISKQLLKLHVDPDNDVASRCSEKIDKLISWIIGKYANADGDVIDIGCGPGLFTQRLAQKGYKVTGIDFSKAAVDYAVKNAKQMKLDIDYRCMNYLELDFREKADLIIMIYCDFCVLSKKEQHKLLSNVYRALKPGGMFVFDVYNEESLNFRELKKEWDFKDDGFWREDPYTVMSMTRHYEENRVVLSQHIIYDEKSGFDIYRFWEHYFTKNDMHSLFDKHEFSSVENCGNPLRDNTKTMEDGITFYIASK